MQNKMQITGKWSRSEPEVEFQYGGRLFFQTRSRYISAKKNYDDTLSRFYLIPERHGQTDGRTDSILILI